MNEYQKKLNVVVLAGGISTERDVSITSATMIQNALIDLGYNAIVVDVYLGYKMKEGSIEDEFNNAKKQPISEIAGKATDISEIKKIKRKNNDGFFGENVLKLCKYADIVFIGLHGQEGENGKIQATFDMLGIKYTGSDYKGSLLAMDKSLSKEIFIANNIKSAKHRTVTKLDCNIDGQQYPCVVKPACGGSSVGVSIAKNKEELETALENGFKYEDTIIIEEYIEGREFSVGVIGGKALPVIEIKPIDGFYDYENKYQAGRTIETCPAEIEESKSDEMKKIAEKVYKCLRLKVYARMDFIMKQNGDIFCLEANTLPGMTKVSLLPQEALAVGIDFGTLCKIIIQGEGSIFPNT